jgi:hypothetical protein
MHVHVHVSQSRGASECIMESDGAMHVFAQLTPCLCFSPIHKQSTLNPCFLSPLFFDGSMDAVWEASLLV